MGGRGWGLKSLLHEEFPEPEAGAAFPMLEALSFCETREMTPPFPLPSVEKGDWRKRPCGQCCVPASRRGKASVWPSLLGKGVMMSQLDS